MRWKNAWTLCQKDLDEVRKQKLVIGSVIFMPLFLGALFPTMMMTPFMNRAARPRVKTAKGKMM